MKNFKFLLIAIFCGIMSCGNQQTSSTSSTAESQAPALSAEAKEAATAPASAGVTQESTLLAKAKPVAESIEQAQPTLASVEATKPAAETIEQAKPILTAIKEAAPSENATAPSSKWVLVVKSNALVEPDQKAEVLKTVKEKWFQEQPFEEIAYEDYKIDNYIGRTVVNMECMRQAGKFHFAIRTGKILEDGAEERIAGPQGFLDNRSTLQDLIREIQALK